MAKNYSEWWQSFLRELSHKIKSPKKDPKNLSEAMRHAKPRPLIYFIFGIHGNILFPEVGYCEFDNSENAWNHIKRWTEFMKDAKGFPVCFEIGIVSINELDKKYPVWALLERNQIEFVNPLYSQPYLRHISEESNIRQFEWGIDELKRHNLSVSVYCSSEHALHPQIPQLLNKFGIKYACLSTRLAGGAPTCYEPKIIWKGMDDSEIVAIISQYGVSNGQIWHGKFFEELPSLIFGGVARPDLNHLVYVNIEDFANPMPGYQDIAEHLSELEKNGLYMKSLAQIISDSNIPISRKVSWTIDDFPLKWMQSRIINKIRVVEDNLVNLESSLTLLYIILEKSNKLTNEISDILKKMFDNLKIAWQKVLMAQNHDGYVVPFTKPGMYSLQQGLEVMSNTNIEDTIEEYGLRLLQETEQIMETTKNILSNMEESNTRLICNWLWERDEFIEGDLYHLPEMGSIIKGKNKTTREYLYPSKIMINQDSSELAIDNLKIKFNKSFIVDENYNLNSPKMTILKGDGWTTKIIYLYSRIEFEFNIEMKLGLDISLNLIPKSKLFITYPFGAEPTQSYFGHSLRFYYNEPCRYLESNQNIYGWMFAHQGVPYFHKTDLDLKIHVDSGNYRFAYAKADSIVEAYKRAWEFFYPPTIIPIQKEYIIEDNLNRVFTLRKDQIPICFYFKNNKFSMRVLSMITKFADLNEHNNFKKSDNCYSYNIDEIIL